MKGAFTTLLVLLLYYEIFVKRDSSHIISTFYVSMTAQNLHLIFLVFLLMPFNWILESVKWKTIVDKFIEITPWESLRMVIAGLTFGIFTPSRVGEYGGRYYMMKKGCKWNTISATFVGSLGQNIVTGIVGLLAAIYLTMSGSLLEKYIFSGALYLVLILVVLGSIVFYNVGFFQRILMKYSSFGWTKKLIEKSKFLEKLTSRDLNRILIISLGRYAIYTTQYMLLLAFFGINISLLEGSCIISLLFLIQSGLPLPPFLGVMARGELAITIWSLYTYNTLGIIATTFSLWFINLIVPVIIGLLLILKKNDM